MYYSSNKHLIQKIYYCFFPLSLIASYIMWVSWLFPRKCEKNEMCLLILVIGICHYF